MCRVLRSTQGKSRNEVSIKFKYIFNQLTNSNGYRHYDIAPNAFQVGDIVEAQISFEVTPLRGQHEKMLVILRALTLLDKGALEVRAIDE